MAFAERSAARQIACTRRLIDESKRAMRAIKEQCQVMQRRIELSRELLRAPVQPALALPVTRRR